MAIITTPRRQRTNKKTWKKRVLSGEELAKARRENLMKFTLDRRAKAEGWKRQNTKSTARMQSWKRGNDRINYWPTTGTMSTRIKHPNRKHPQQMYRRKVDAELAKQILSNPRKHTGKGYYTKNKRSRQKHGGNDSTGSSSSTTSERKRKKRKRRR